MNKRVKSNSIRIIAGVWRGRRLPVLDHQGLRPTTDRVRETVFNWLMHDVAGAQCLDLFAGSGALGFECLSILSVIVAMQVWICLKSLSCIDKVRPAKARILSIRFLRLSFSALI